MIAFLWQHRVHRTFGSRIWFKQWAKRLVTLPNLIVFAYRVIYLRLRGAEINDGTVLSSIRVHGNAQHLRIGSNSFVGQADIQLHGQVEIGSFVCINDGVRLITASHDVRDSNWATITRPIRIGDHVWIATGAIVMPGVTIGCGAVVGAGAVVVKDVPEHAVATGNPARIRGNIRPAKLNYSPTDFIAFRTAWLGLPVKT